jgi:uncharacterized protein YheU (UPF0270 family)
MNEEKPLPPVEIPASSLSNDTLSAMIESFILREGTDYGVTEVSLETKIKQVRKQLDSGDVKIVFDANTETVNFISQREYRTL